MDYKAQLIAEVRQKVDFLIGDCRTLLACRTDHYTWFATDSSLGAGNYLMTTGLMALLGVLAKVHLWLVEPGAFTTEEDRVAVKTAIDQVKKAMPELKNIVQKRWQVLRVGECNEQRAFAKFIVAMLSCVDLGLENDADAEEVWRVIRNRLTHMAAPHGGAAVYQGSFSYGFRPGRSPHQALDALSVGIHALGWSITPVSLSLRPTHLSTIRQLR
jgi:hypothetical protein